ncbi:MAG: TlpA disulfide reductase family protein [Ilumatobacteraceae bacterium]
MDKRLLFGSLGVAVAVIVGVTIATANRNDTAAPVGSIDDVTLTSGNDLSPTIGTNAAVTGKSLPHVDVQTLAGDAFATSDLVGRPLVINFWYSGCLPCKKELPAFAAVQAALGDRVRIVGVDALPASATEEAFARDNGVQYELFYDTNGELTSAVGVAAFPQTLFVDAKGTIVDQTGELTADKLESLIRTKLL